MFLLEERNDEEAASGFHVRIFFSINAANSLRLPSMAGAPSLHTEPIMSRWSSFLAKKKKKNVIWSNTSIACAVVFRDWQKRKLCFHFFLLHKTNELDKPGCHHSCRWFGYGSHHLRKTLSAVSSQLPCREQSSPFQGHMTWSVPR